MQCHSSRANHSSKLQNGSAFFVFFLEKIRLLDTCPYIWWCRPFGRLWWDETVPTVVTRAEPHNQVSFSTNYPFMIIPATVFTASVVCIWSWSNMLSTGYIASDSSKSPDYPGERKVTGLPWLLPIVWPDQGEVSSSFQFACTWSSHSWKLSAVSHWLVSYSSWNQKQDHAAL